MPQLRLAMAQVDSTVGDLTGNARAVREWTAKARDGGAHLVAFPEMHLTGYPVEDLALRSSFVDASRTALLQLARDLDADGLGHIAVVDGEEPSGLQRAVLTADSGNGVSASLDWNAWSFVNIDLDVHLSRPLVGEWVLLDAATRYEPTGTALAASALSDEQGPAGRAAQKLVVTPRVSGGQV